MPRRLPTHGLFGGIALPDEAKERANEAIRAVESADVDHILSQDTELLVDEFLDEFGEVAIVWDDTLMVWPNASRYEFVSMGFGSVIVARDGQFSDIVAKAVQAVSEHAQCQKVHSAADPARRSDYTYTRADDPDRAIHLAVLPFKLLG